APMLHESSIEYRRYRNPQSENLQLARHSKGNGIGTAILSAMRKMKNLSVAYQLKHLALYTCGAAIRRINRFRLPPIHSGFPPAPAWEYSQVRRNFPALTAVTRCPRRPSQA